VASGRNSQTHRAVEWGPLAAHNVLSLLGSMATVARDATSLEERMHGLQNRLVGIDGPAKCRVGSRTLSPSAPQ